ncbi:hopanoid C-3 methylase HpnR [Streptomyces capparidis]
MRLLLVRPSVLTYSEVFARLEPLGLARVAAAAGAAGHRVRVVDLQVESRDGFARELSSFAPDAVGVSLNNLAEVPAGIGIARQVRRTLPRAFVFFGGHGVSFVAERVLQQAEGAVDAVVRGEGEPAVGPLLDAVRDGGAAGVPGVVTADGAGPPPRMPHGIDEPRPARDLLRHRRRYFVGELDPCASVEFTRGCPWDCSFCSAWTFYGHTYRGMSAPAAAEELARVREPNVFLVDDVAFLRPEHGDAIAAEVERRRVRRRYHLQTRGDVLLRNPEVFERWSRLGLRHMFLGVDALDAEGLDRFRRRTTPDDNFHALEAARRLGIRATVDLVVDPAWDAGRFRAVREFARAIPEAVHLTVMTPYPGTESWHTEARRLTTRDYRLFDTQHAVLPTRLPLEEFYQELARIQAVAVRKHLGPRTAPRVLGVLGGNLLRGRTNSVRALWRSGRVCDPGRRLADHRRPVPYELPLPPQVDAGDRRALYVHGPAPAPGGDAAAPAGPGPG